MCENPVFLFDKKSFNEFKNELIDAFHQVWEKTENDAG